MNVETNIADRPDPRVAMAETWLFMLGGLREVGRRFCRYLVHQILPLGPAPQAPFLTIRFRGDPTKAYERVLRTLRFAAVLCLRIETEIAAWRAGTSFDLDAFLAKAPLRRGRSNCDTGADDEVEPWQDLEALKPLAPVAPLRLNFPDSERPSREDPYVALLKGPLKDAIAAICKELGLKPDWSLWTDRGFPPPARGGVEDWVAFFVSEGAPPDRTASVTRPRAAIRAPGERLEGSKRGLHDVAVVVVDARPHPPP